MIKPFVAAPVQFLRPWGPVVPVAGPQLHASRIHWTVQNLPGLFLLRKSDPEGAEHQGVERGGRNLKILSVSWFLHPFFLLQEKQPHSVGFQDQFLAFHRNLSGEGAASPRITEWSGGTCPCCNILGWPTVGFPANVGVIPGLIQDRDVLLEPQVIIKMWGEYLVYTCGSGFGVMRLF